MVKAKYKNYCDKASMENTDTFFRLDMRGRAIFCGVAYPTKESRSDLACKKILEISAESFIRRPSVCDEAVDTISTFMNEGIYIFQEKEKQFLCSAAILFVFRGEARCIVSGDAGICHFRDGKLIRRITGDNIPLFGARIRWKHKAQPEFDISQGENAFLLYSGIQTDASETILEQMEYWRGEDAVTADFDKQHCSVAALVLPNKKSWLERGNSE